MNHIAKRNHKPEYNKCNIGLEIDETFRTCTCNMCVKHMKHPNKTLVTCNMKPLAAI
jgi:hypothetical protein